MALSRATVVQRIYLPDFNPNNKPVVLVLYSNGTVKWERPPT